MSWSAMSEGDAATDGVGWAGLGWRRRGLVWAGRRRTALARAGLGRRWVREMSAMGEREE